MTSRRPCGDAASHYEDTVGTLTAQATELLLYAAAITPV